MRRGDRGYAVVGRIYSIPDFLYYNKSSDKSNFKSNVNSNNISNLKNFNKNNERSFDKDFRKSNEIIFKI